ncbi:MAG: enoyl-CoA hydratase/isomerase family protein [Solirubrobacteraceae bacterium]
MGQRVRIARADGVATVTIVNPPVNAMDDETIVALQAAAEQLARDQDVRAVVLTGSGTKAFVAGADLASIGEHLGVESGMDAHVALTRPMFEAWSQLRQPLIAAIQAHAVGGGLELALLCDLIVADPRARFGLPEVTLGLMPGGGGTQRLPRRIATALALELMLLGELIPAERAARIGIVNEVAEEGAALQRAEEIAKRIAALPALAVQSIKRAGRQASEVGLSDGLQLERDLFLRTAASADAREGASAFLRHRTAHFEHR